MKVYLDCCCYCRQFDDLTQEQVRAEVKAIVAIFRLHAQGSVSLVGSDVLTFEFGKISDRDKRTQILRDYSNVDEVIEISDSNKSRANQIQELSNIHAFDAAHIACAEEAGADVMLTTDYKLIKMASRIDLELEVMNPRDCFEKILNGGDFNGTDENEL
ncbi:MAG: PIN domain-containing protein [Oscillospiraceae bacterium]|nr:PIN domain-containing protein [Oscillospiraceae bacterium]